MGRVGRSVESRPHSGQDPLSAHNSGYAKTNPSRFATPGNPSSGPVAAADSGAEPLGRPGATERSWVRPYRAALRQVTSRLDFRGTVLAVQQGDPDFFLPDVLVRCERARKTHRDEAR